MSWFSGKKSEHDDTHGSPKFVQKKGTQNRRESARKDKMDKTSEKRAKPQKDARRD